MSPAASPPNEIHTLHLQRLAAYPNDSERVLADWDAHADEYAAPQGWPPDDDGHRAERRAAKTDEAFENVRADALHLLATAETQLAGLPDRLMEDRWVWQISVLCRALNTLNAPHAEWRQTRDCLPIGARPGTDAFNTTLTEYQAEAWSCSATRPPMDTLSLRSTQWPGIPLQSWPRHRAPPQRRRRTQ
ncbi:hypothetical protein ACIQNU_42370 [Streptomyces sp. NPDC091292]|uniref:hypothetical protein n=1 Tax=Streptomyces sp. NPDC091292 TaxID=3365991 RepID=UPI003818A5C4